MSSDPVLPASAARQVVCIQGLGFVGFAMAVAVADARDAGGEPYFNVVGVDLPTSEGREKVSAILEGRLPVATRDQELAEAFQRVLLSGNLSATTDEDVYARADVTVVDVHLDITQSEGVPSFNLDGFRKAIATLGARMRPGSLIVVETTVPPGTCELVAAPELKRQLEIRGLPATSILLAHSYERVMPGREYFRSIVNFWRVYAGHTPPAAETCAAFLSKVINVRDYPLSRLGSTTASETAKVLENSYRAANIAFIEEWGQFAEAVGIDLFEIVDAIRVRPTHSNIRYPGFGVGGYCLTKDPLFGFLAARDLFGFRDLNFPFSTRAVAVNAASPLRALERLRGLLGGKLTGRRLLLLGVSYRSDVGDTRHSPSEVFYRTACSEGAHVTAHDPLVTYWREVDRELPLDIPSPEGFDAVIFAVAHTEYCCLDLGTWLGSLRPVVLDANRVLRAAQRKTLRSLGCRTASIGAGDQCLGH